MAKTIDDRKTVAIPLFEPVTVEGVTYTTLTMRRPKAKDGINAAKAKGSEADRGIRLFAILCDVTDEVILELDEVDTDKLSDQYNAFKGRQSATA